MWGTGLFGFPAGDAVDLTQAQSANMLYADDIGLATSEGAAMFLYGELSGKLCQSTSQQESLRKKVYGIMQL